MAQLLSWLLLCALCSVVAAGAVARAIPAADVQAFERTLDGYLVLPGNSSYAAASGAWNKVMPLRRPVMVVFCYSPNDVSASIKFLRKHRTRFTVRASGHSALPNTVLDGQAVIDISHLDWVEMEAGPSSRVRVGGAAKLGRIAYVASQRNLTASLASAPDVTVGGYLSGGGHGIGMRRYGLGCDAIVSAQVVLASGRLVTASNQSHTDLYWALRGGGAANFGVVVSYTLQLQPTTVNTYGIINFPLSQLQTVMLWYTAMLYSNNTDFAFYLGVWRLEPGAAPCVSLFGTYFADNATTYNALRVFLDEASEVQLTQGSFYDAYQFIGADDKIALAWQIYSRFAYGELMGDPAWPSKMAQLIEAAPQPDAYGGSGGILFLEPMGGRVAAVRNKDTAYAHRGAWANFAGDIVYANATKAKNNAIRQWIHNVSSQMGPHLAREAYLNYPDVSLSDFEAPKAYYASNLERLISIRRKYDPDGVFTHAQSIPLKDVYDHHDDHLKPGAIVAISFVCGAVVLGGIVLLRRLNVKRAFADEQALLGSHVSFT